MLSTAEQISVWQHMSKQPFISPSEKQIIKWIEKNISHFKIRRTPTHGDIYMMPNPAAIGSGGYKLGISPSKGWVKDVRPQYKTYTGSFLSFVSKYRRCSFHDAITEVCGSNVGTRSLVEYAIDQLNKRRETAKEEYEPVEEERLALPPGLVPITDKTKPRAWAVATNYLASRHISLETATKYDIRYSSSLLCFPYYEYGSIVYWQTRQIINKKFDFPKGIVGGKTVDDYLHGFDFAEPGTTIILVESFFNEAVIGDGAMSTGGAALKKRQFGKIKTLFPGKIILAPDLDDAGVKSLRANYEILAPHYRDLLYYCLPPKQHLNLEKEENDWNDMAKNINHLANPEFIKSYIEENCRPLNLRNLMRLTVKH